MTRVRRILAVTGARSEYDLLSPVYERLHHDPRFELRLVVTGPHLSENFGKTANYVTRDGYTVADRIYNLIDTSEKIGRVISLGNQIAPLAHVLRRETPDIVLVAGDREEALSVTIAAAYLDTPVAHFFGGDIAKDGNVDNSVRYAASKLAHLHFPTLEEHRQTLLKLGEDDWRIFVVGNPALDKFLLTPQLSRAELSAQLRFDLGVDSEPYAVLIQHPIITEYAAQDHNIRVTLDALVATGVKCCVNYPNSDPGNAVIISAYQEYAKRYPAQFHLFQNLDRDAFVNLFRHAAVLVGNSSSGILEAPSLGLPTVNVGTRQRGRHHGQNVIFTDYNVAEITAALQKSITDEAYRAAVRAAPNPYGDGHSAARVVEALASVTLDDRLVYKNSTY